MTFKQDEVVKLQSKEFGNLLFTVVEPTVITFDKKLNQAVSMVVIQPIKTNEFIKILRMINDIDANEFETTETIQITVKKDMIYRV